MQHFHHIIYGCDITIKRDHMNITQPELNHVNLRVLRQLIALDQAYQVKLEHIAGTSNMGADSLGRLHMHDTITDILVQEVYTINKLDRTDNLDFPLSMDRIREEQNLHEKLQGLIQSKPKKSH